MATERLPKGLIKRGDTYHMRFTLKGVTVAESTHTKVLREAERILAKRRSELQTDVVLNDIRQVTFHTAIDTFIRTRATAGARQNALRSLQPFKTLPDVPLKRVEQHQVDERLVELRSQYATSTMSMITTYWNSFCKWCTENKYAAPAKVKIAKRGEGRIRWLTAEEQAALLQQLDPATPYKPRSEWLDKLKQNNYDLTVMLLDTGLRYSEGAKMNWSQVDFARRCLYVVRGKAGKPTTLAMTERLHAILLRRRQEEGTHVFDQKAGAQNRASIWMKAAAKRAGISTAQGEITPHVMRHTFASTMIQNGMGLSEVQYLLGHSAIEMTQRYAHFRKQDATDKAAAIMNQIAQQPKSTGNNVVKFG